MTNDELIASVELEISKILNQLEIDSKRIVDRIGINKSRVEQIGKSKLDKQIIVKRVCVALYPDYEMSDFGYNDIIGGFPLPTEEIWFEDWLNLYSKEDDKYIG